MPACRVEAGDRIQAGVRCVVSVAEMLGGRIRARIEGNADVIDFVNKAGSFDVVDESPRRVLRLEDCHVEHTDHDRHEVSIGMQRYRSVTRDEGEFSGGERNIREYRLLGAWRGPFAFSGPSEFGVTVSGHRFVVRAVERRARWGAVEVVAVRPVILCENCSSLAANEVRAIADDIATILSFALRTRLVIYGEQHFTIEHDRITDDLLLANLWLEAIPERRRSEYAIYSHGRLETFVAVAVHQLRAHPHPRLREALAYLSMHRERETGQGEFLDLMVALETYATFEAQRARLLTNGQEDRLRRLICDSLEGLGVEAPARALVKAKIPELRRPALGTVLRRICDRLGIETADLGVDNGSESWPFLRVRNDLVHGLKQPPMDDIVRETLRVRHLLERIMLRELTGTGDPIAPDYDPVARGELRYIRGEPPE